MFIPSALLIIQDSRGGKKAKPQDTSGHDYPSGYGGYIKVQGTRKLDCPATLQVRTVRLYTDYTLALEEYSSKKSLRKAKAAILRELKNEMQKGKILSTATRFYFKVPLSTAHRVHPVDEAGTVGHSLHPKIANKICELVSENITNANVVRKCLERYVEKEMFGDQAPRQKPKRSNRRYYPSRQDLRGHIARAVSASKYCNDDQEFLRRK